MKKIITLGLSSLLIFTGVACNSSPTTSGNQTSSVSTASTSEVTVTASSTGSLAYVDSLFDTSYVHEINVEIDSDDWLNLLENPTDKTKYSTTVTIDGTELTEVSFATKGNTSLSDVANSDSDRYSFKLNFGKFVDGQTYQGLDKLNLNNIYSDSTYLKDYMSYRIMAEAGVAAPLVSFVSLWVNGEAYGLYVAIEEVGDSFLERNYGEDYGELYKPESEKLQNVGAPGAGGNPPNGGDFTPPNRDGTTSDGTDFTPPDRADFTPPEGGGPNVGGTPPDGTDFTPPEGGGGFGGESNGADLVYTDDEISSYSDIFDNAETKSTQEDHQRVIQALQQLSTGENLESCVDEEAVLRYFVAHNFVINYDSYTGNMLHNYYLYEKNSILTMLPWDYNLAFGGFNDNTASEDINWPIDSPLADKVSEEDRPIWSMLIADETNLESYHRYYDELLSNYFENGRFESEMDTVSQLIRPYVESDPTAFVTVEEFDIGVKTLKEFCLLRAQSIRGQIDGTIPSTAQGQSEDSSSLIDASSIDISAMGKMKGGGKDGGGRPNQNATSDTVGSDSISEPTASSDTDSLPESES